MSDSFASSQSDKSYTDVRGDSREGGGGGGVSSGNRPAIPHRSSLNLSLAGSTSSLATYKQHHSIPQALKCIPQCSESVYHIAGLVDDRGGRFEKYRKTKEELDGIRYKKVRRFYERQNAILDGFAEVDAVLDSTHSAPENDETAPLLPLYNKKGGGEQAPRGLSKAVNWAINVNFMLNAALLGGKIMAALLSNSISLIASLVDSAMDFLSTLIIWTTARSMERRDWRSEYEYPVGKKRMEPMGVVIFAVFMISSFFQVFVESLKRLFDPNLETAEIPLSGMAIMVATIVIKSFVWVWCRKFKNTSVQALALDAENDVVFNFFSLLFPYIGQFLNWKWLDPLGGAVLSLYIIIEWTHTLFHNFGNLTGKRATPEEHQRIIYLVTRFSPLINALQHVEVYHVGDNLIVETDVVLPADTALPMSHNLGESVQFALESLEGVERAYTHVDYSSSNPSSHVQR